MALKVCKWVLSLACGVLAACAIITVNVYFPEKDVKQAYKSMDEMLLHQGEKKDEAPAQPEQKPQSSLKRGLPVSFSLVDEACAAAEAGGDELAVELSGMPEVLKAYDEMKARLAKLDALRDSGVVGETKQGLVTVRDKAKGGAAAEAIVKAENDNRKTVMGGMAKAIMKLHPDTKQNPNQVLAKASALFAETKREAAKAGWWMELANGKWIQK